MLGRTAIVGRRYAQRAPDFARIAAKVTSQTTRADVAALRSAMEERKQLAAAVAAPVQPIDWAFYEKTISDKKIVADMKKAYEEIQIPAFVSDIGAESTKELEAFMAEALEGKNKSAARIAELEAELAVLLANRTSEETTIAEVAAKVPQLDAEARQEIAEGNWAKDTPLN